MKGTLEVLKSFFVSNGEKTSFRPTFFWVTVIMLGLIVAIYLEIIEGKGARIPLISTLLGSVGVLLGIYNYRKTHGPDRGGDDVGKG